MSTDTSTGDGCCTEVTMDLATVTTSVTTILQQALRGAETMNVHDTDLGAAVNLTALDTWTSGVAAFDEEAASLGGTVLEAITAFLRPAVDALTRADGLRADQARVAGTPALGAAVGGAQAGVMGIVAGGPSGGGNAAHEALTQMILSQMPGMPSLVDVTSATGNSAKVWLAQDGLSFAGQDSSGSDVYRNERGDVGGLGSFFRDTQDRNNNGRTTDLD